MGFKLIEDAKHWHKLWSMRWAIITVIVSSLALAYSGLPSDWQAAIPNWAKATFAGLTLFTGTATAVSRLVKQNNLPGRQE